MWSEQGNTCVEVATVHTAAIVVLQWSGAGGRLVSGDTAGSVVGWTVERTGRTTTAFHHELKDALAQVRASGITLPFGRVHMFCLAGNIPRDWERVWGAPAGHVGAGAGRRGRGRARAGPVLLLATQDRSAGWRGWGQQ